MHTWMLYTYILRRAEGEERRKKTNIINEVSFFKVSKPSMCVYLPYLYKRKSEKERERYRRTLIPT